MKYCDDAIFDTARTLWSAQAAFYTMHGSLKGKPELHSCPYENSSYKSTTERGQIECVKMDMCLVQAHVLAGVKPPKALF